MNIAEWSKAMNKKCSTINVVDEAQAITMGLIQRDSIKGDARKSANTAKPATGP